MDGGYLGADFETFFSAVVLGAAGVFVGILTEDAGIATDLTITTGQRVSVSGDRALPTAPVWGSGGFTVQQLGSLELTYVAVQATKLSVLGGKWVCTGDRTASRSRHHTSSHSLLASLLMCKRRELDQRPDPSRECS